MLAPVVPLLNDGMNGLTPSSVDQVGEADPGPEVARTVNVVMC